MKQFIITLCLFLAFFSGCRKDIPLPNESAKKLFGEWEWIKSTGGYGGEIITANSQLRKHLSFKANGMYYAYLNGKKEKQSPYTLKNSEPIGYYANGVYYLCGTQIDYNKENAMGIPSQTVCFANNDSLILSDICDDCFVNYYVRQK